MPVLFTFVYATEARLRRAEKVLLPVLDILQSMPVLGFLPVTVTAFINLFPGSQLGLERASVFAIFTSMAWNMTFAFYYSLMSQPRDLDEAAQAQRPCGGGCSAARSGRLNRAVMSQGRRGAEGKKCGRGGPGGRSSWDMEWGSVITPLERV